MSVQKNIALNVIKSSKNTSLNLGLKSLVLLILFSISPFSELFSQKYLNEGNKYYDRNMFEEAIPLYLKELEKGTFKTKNSAREKLASCYRLTGRFLEANKMYKQVLEKSGKTNKPENILNYANSLKSSAEYAEAAIQFENYITLMPNDPMGKVYLESCHMVQKWLDLPEESYVSNFEKINTSFSEFSPVYYNNSLVFTSDREGSLKKFINLSENTSEVGTDLFYVDLQNINAEKIIIQNLTDVNSFGNDGTSTFSPDQKKIYFSRTVIGKKDKKSNQVLASLQVFCSEQNPDGTWTEPVSAFSFNSDKYSVGQPSLSPDGKRIFYFSDMPGGFGKADIYYSNLETDGTWGAPVNVGNTVNTFGEELFPYIFSNDSLYFSSDTHPGMGKLDIFLSTKTDGKWGNVINMKPPVNSIGDDFGFVLNKDKNRGFFSSDRDNGKGKEDIYTYYKEGTINIQFVGNKIRIPDYSIYNGLSFKITEDGQTESVALPSENGFFEYQLKDNTSYKMSIRKNGFSFDQVKIRLAKNPGKEYFMAEVTAQNSGLLLTGTVGNETVQIIPIPATGKGTVATTDTIIDLKPLPDVPVEIQESTGSVPVIKNRTDRNGEYVFTDTLAKGKLYTLRALLEATKAVAEKKPVVNQTVKQTAKKDTVINKPVPEVKQAVVVPEQKLVAKQDTLPKPQIIIPDAKPTVAEQKKPEIINIHGTVKESKNGKLVTECPVKVIINQNEVYETSTNKQGVFNMYIPKSPEYQVVVTKIGFFQKQVTVGVEKLTSAQSTFEIPIDPIVVNKTIELKNILFDLNKEALRKESIIELEKLKDFLLINPDIYIELNAHTDTRGDYYLNLQLSEKRAETVRNYLLSKGIAASRIISHGFGKTFPLIVNAITESDNEKNRRVEFRILEKKNAESQLINLPKGIQILSECPFTQRKPIPMVAQVPQGVSYRVKIGEFPVQLPVDTLKGLFPVVWTINAESSTIAYYAGFFTKKEDAENAAEIIRKDYYSGATVEMSKNGSRIVAEQPVEAPKAQPAPEPVKTNVVKADTIAREATPPFYTLQIGAFKEPIAPATISKFAASVPGYEIITSKYNGNNILSVGKFESYNDAFTAQKKLVESKKIKDNFIIGVQNGVKITVTEVKRQLKK